MPDKPTNLELIERHISIHREQLAALRMHPGIRQNFNRALDALKDAVDSLQHSQMCEREHSDFDDDFKDILAILNGETGGKTDANNPSTT